MVTVFKGIVFVDMLERDQRAFRHLRGNMEEGTMFSSLNIGKLAELMACNRDTASAMVDRLAGAGYVKKHGGAGRPGVQVEILREDILI